MLLFPKALQNTVGIVFPLTSAILGNVCLPPKPLQMCGVEWHVIGRLNEKAKVVSIDLLKWLQLGTVLNQQMWLQAQPVVVYIIINVENVFSQSCKTETTSHSKIRNAPINPMETIIVTQ